MYRYSTGEEVRVGDCVLTAGGIRKGVVEKVIAPGTPDSMDYHCFTTGGVLINEDWGGKSSLLLTSPTFEGEDLIFVERDPSMPDGSMPNKP